MSASLLAAGLLALHSNTIELVPASPTYPYVVASVTFPTAVGRALSGDAQGLTVRAVFNVVAETAEGVRVVSQAVHDDVEGAVPSVTGFACGPVRLRNARPPIEDSSVTNPTTNLHPLVGVLEYEFTAAPTA